MTRDARQLADTLKRKSQPYLASHRSMGLGLAAISGGSECLVFGGKVLPAADPTPPHKDTLFEIGSITKVFTTTLLAEMHAQGEVELNDRVNRYLPPHGRLACRGGEDVTLLQLATHTSGLPRLPSNLSWAKLVGDNPYADYSPDDLYSGLATCQLKHRPGTRTLYSNLGSGLLGHVLSLAAGIEYEQLLTERVLRLLGMHDTAIRLSNEQQRRLASGHATGKHVRNWGFPALAGAGALRSTISDMARFLAANLDPASTPLAGAIERTHEIRTQFRWKWYRDFGCIGPVALVGGGGLLAWQSFGLPLWLRWLLPIAVPIAILPLWQFGIIGSVDDMALGWHVDRLDRGDDHCDDWALWHNGGTAGYASYLAFSRQQRAGVVLLANSDHQPDSLGRNLLMELLAHDR